MNSTVTGHARLDPPLVRRGAIWATENPLAHRSLPVPAALGIASFLTGLVIAGLCVVDFVHPPEPQPKTIRVQLVREEPPPPVPVPVPPAPVEPPKPVTPPPPRPVPVPRPTPPRPAPAPTPAQPHIAAAEAPTQAAPAVATAAAGPATAPVETPPAPPAPVATPRASAVQIGLVCPSMVQPVVPMRVMQSGLSGVFTVQARATIKGGKVVKVEILRADRPEFRNPVMVAMQQYECESRGAEEVTAEQEFVFRLHQS